MLLFLSTIDDPVIKTKFEEVYELYKKDAFYEAYHYLKDIDLSYDIVQEVFIKLFDCGYIESIMDIYDTNVKYYIIRSSKNKTIDYLRKNKIEGIHKSSVIDISEYNTILSEDEFLEDGVVKNETINEIKAIVDQMNPDYSDIIKMRYYDGLSNDKISEILQIKNSNTRARLSRALSSLRRLYKERNGEF